MSLTVKAYLHKDWISEPIETRRFALDQDVATNYTYVTEKLAKIFPQLRAQDITISYLDGEGDRVTVSSDEELTDALDQFDGTIFRLHIQEKRSESDGTAGSLPFIPPFFQCPLRFTNGGASRFGCNPQNCQKQDNDTDATTPMEDTPSDGQPKPKEEDEKPSQQNHCGRNSGQRQWPGGFGGPFNFNFGPFAGTFDLWSNQGNRGGNNTTPFWGPGHCTGFRSDTTAQDDKGKDKPEYTEVLEQLQAMGFEDEGGWLHELVKAKQGDLQKILDALHPTTEDSATAQ